MFPQQSQSLLDFQDVTGVFAKCFYMLGNHVPLTAKLALSFPGMYG
jgi:hypothetical protein